MLRDITIGQYFPGNSVVHRMDPRFKIVMTLLFIVMLFLGEHLYSLGYGLVYCLIVLLLSRIPVKMIWKSVRPLLPILLITAALDMFFLDDGTVYFHWHFLKITSDGVNTAVLMVVRIIVLLVGSSLLTYTTSPIALTDAIERLLAPLKRLHVPVHAFAMMMTIALRFIPTLLEETDRIMTAQKARGASFSEGSMLQRAKALVPIFVPLFVSSFRRAEELATAMECRCYRGDEGRTKMRQLHAAGLYASDVVQIRYLLATLFVGLYLLVFHRDKFRIRLRDLWCFLGTGLCSLLLYCIFYFRAFERVSISIATVLTYMSPIYIMLLGTLLFREKITPRKVLALVLSIGGCVLVSGVLSGISGSPDGLLAGFAAGFFYALYSIFAKFAIDRGYQTWTILFYTFGLAAIGCAFVSDWGAIGAVLSTQPVAIPLCLLFGVVTCFFPYLFYSMGLQRIELSRASILNCVDVVSSSLLGAVLFQEYPSWSALLGIALILTAVVLLSTTSKKRST